MPPNCRTCGAPECLRKHLGKWGWLSITGFVVVWDLYAPETLSAVFLRRRTRPTTIVAWTILTAHLFGALPERYDPIVHLFHFLGGGNDRLPASP